MENKKIERSPLLKKAEEFATEVNIDIRNCKTGKGMLLLVEEGPEDGRELDDAGHGLQAACGDKATMIHMIAVFLARPQNQELLKIAMPLAEAISGLKDLGINIENQVEK